MLAEKERRQKKWEYIQTNMPDLAELLLQTKSEGISFEEPLLYDEDGKPFDSYTIDYHRKHPEHKNPFKVS